MWNDSSGKHKINNIKQNRNLQCLKFNWHRDIILTLFFWQIISWNKKKKCIIKQLLRKISDQYDFLIFMSTDTGQERLVVRCFLRLSNQYKSSTVPGETKQLWNQVNMNILYMQRNICSVYIFIYIHVYTRTYSSLCKCSKSYAVQKLTINTHLLIFEKLNIVTFCRQQKKL